MTSELQHKHCESCEGIGEALNAEQIKNLRPQVHKNWQVSSDNKSIHRDFSFADFYETVEFINAIAWIANKENHHPDLEAKYKTCRVIFYTHAINGLSINDFICAAKIDALLD